MARQTLDTPRELLHYQLRSALTMENDSLVALGNEHFEIATYKNLIIPVTALGEKDALALLKYNLDQETHTSDELLAELKRRSG